MQQCYLVCTSSLGEVWRLPYIFKFMVKAERCHEADSGKLKGQKTFCFWTEL